MCNKRAVSGVVLGIEPGVIIKWWHSGFFVVAAKRETGYSQLVAFLGAINKIIGEMEQVFTTFDQRS